MILVFLCFFYLFPLPLLLSCGCEQIWAVLGTFSDSLSLIDWLFCCWFLYLKNAGCGWGGVRRGDSFFVVSQTGNPMKKVQSGILPCRFKSFRLVLIFCEKSKVNPYRYSDILLYYGLKRLNSCRSNLLELLVSILLPCSLLVHFRFNIYLFHDRIADLDFLAEIRTGLLIWFAHPVDLKLVDPVKGEVGL